MEACLSNGEYDHLIKIAVTGTAGYEEFLRQNLYKLPALHHGRATLSCAG